MAEQAPVETHGQAALARTTEPHEAHHGRPASWVATCIIVVGFIVGGFGLVTGPTWWLFWTGAGIVVLGALFGAANHIMDDWY